MLDTRLVMRITRRTSGGRGEYEISEATPRGVTPNDLLGRSIILELPNGWRINSGTELTAQGGKRRLRLTSQQATQMQVQRQVAAALMLPEPVRADEAFGVGEPVLQTGRYAIDHILIREAELVGNSTAILTVRAVILRNGSVQAAELQVGDRLQRLSAVWSTADEFPPDIADLVKQHREAVSSGAAISTAVERIVEHLQTSMSERSTDIGIVYSQQTDVLDALEAALDISVDEPLIQPSEVDPEEPDIRMRTVKEWKRWANARGPKSARFRYDVRHAYRATCVVCGDHFPPTSFSAPGVDAAHILPWSDYDLDEVQNGLCLCKLHHWAFDEALILITPESRAYSVALLKDIEDRLLAIDPNFSVETLRRAAGRIPEERLPRNRAHWPRPEFLQSLNSVLPS